MDDAPRALVDVRSHILWGLEYGLIDLDRSLAMLRMAAKHGTTDIVATPRVSSEYQFDSQVVAQILEKLRARCNGAIGIHISCDFHFGYSSVRDVLDNPQRYAINGLRYLLVDFANTLIPPDAEEILCKFLAEGLIPIIAHPERNPILQDSLERLKTWISMGCVLEVTARSLSGHFGKLEEQCAWKLLRERMVFVVASDGRDLRHHPPRLDGAWRLIKNKLGEDVARRLLIENPSLIIHGDARMNTVVLPIIADSNAEVVR